MYILTKSIQIKPVTVLPQCYDEPWIYARVFRVLYRPVSVQALLWAYHFQGILQTIQQT